MEYIVIDGGSTDGSAELISNYDKLWKFDKFIGFYYCSEHDGIILFPDFKSKRM